MTSRVLTLQGKKVFHPQEIHFSRTRPQSKQINEIPNHAVIITTNGMANGGRILHHLQQRLPDPKNTILFTGYQAEGTRGRGIIEGEPSVKIYGEHVQVRAKVEMISGFSGHADYNEIMAWLMGFNKPPEKTFVVHGETESSQALAEKIRKQFGWEVVVPGLGEGFDLNL
jgi:metallo-beta-lactamase family protein